jgi:hypothetical protein
LDSYGLCNCEIESLDVIPLLMMLCTRCLSPFVIASPSGRGNPVRDVMGGVGRYGGMPKRPLDCRVAPFGSPRNDNAKTSGLPDRSAGLYRRDWMTFLARTKGAGEDTFRDPPKFKPPQVFVGGGTSKSLHIRLTSKSRTSLCLGTADLLRLSGRHQIECLLPSRSNSQLCEDK